MTAPRADFPAPWYAGGMTRNYTVTIPLSDVDRARLAELAAAREESEEAVASEAVHAYLSVQARHVAEITRAFEESERPDAHFVPTRTGRGSASSW